MFKGIAYKVASTLAFALMAALVKALSGKVSVAEIAFFRSIFSLLTLVAWLRHQGAFPRGVATKNPFGHLRRSLLGVTGMFGTFYALSALPIAKATAISFAAPLMVVPLATLFLGEKANPFRWAAVLVGFAGVLVMLSDRLFNGDGSLGLGETVAVCTACVSAIAVLQVRHLTRTEPTGAIVFYFFLMGLGAMALALSLGALAPRGWPVPAWIAWTAPDAKTLALLALLGVLGGFGQILMTQSFRHADAAVIAAFEYTSILWTASLGVAFFGEGVSAHVALGALVVVGSGLMILLRERAPRPHKADEIAPASPEEALAEEF